MNTFMQQHQQASIKTHGERREKYWTEKNNQSCVIIILLEF